jgi:LuxR family maltose regulon positive regulatory protein
MNFARAHTLLELGESQGSRRGWGRLSAAAMLERTPQCLAEGRMDEAVECLNRLERLAAEYPAPVNCAWSDIHRYAALARAHVASAEQRFDDAISILSGLQRELTQVNNLHYALRVQTHLAIVKFRAKQTTEALEIFRDVVTKFARAGIYYPILDERTRIGPLLVAFQESAERTGTSPELMAYISNLIAVWMSRYQLQPQQTSTSATPEALSARENDILKLIGDGLSNKEIARNLDIAPETVKSHVKNIFTKLNVETRAQAVSRAQILGLAGTER